MLAGPPAEVVRAVAAGLAALPFALPVAAWSNMDVCECYRPHGCGGNSNPGLRAHDVHHVPNGCNVQLGIMLSCRGCVMIAEQNAPSPAARRSPAAAACRSPLPPPRRCLAGAAAGPCPSPPLRLRMQRRSSRHCPATCALVWKSASAGLLPVEVTNDHRWGSSRQCGTHPVLPHLALDAGRACRGQSCTSHPSHSCRCP